MAEHKQVKNVTELIEELKACWPDFSTNAGEFISPTPTSIIRFYERFLQAFKIRPDVIMQVLSQQHNIADHENITYIFILYLCVFYIYSMVETISINTSFRNFIYPADDNFLINRGRLFNNFFFYEKMFIENQLAPITVQILEEANYLDALHRGNFIVKKDLEVSGFVQANKITILESLRKEAEELQNIVAEKQTESEKREKGIEALNAQIKALEAETDALAHEVETNLQKGKELKTLLFDDHEVLQAEYKQLLEEINELSFHSPEYVTNLESKIKIEADVLHLDDQISQLTSGITKKIETFELREECEAEMEKLLTESRRLHQIEKEELDNLNQLRCEVSDLDETNSAISLEIDTHRRNWKKEKTLLKKKLEELIDHFEKVTISAKEQTDKLNRVRTCHNEFISHSSNHKEFYNKLKLAVPQAVQALNDKVEETFEKIDESFNSS